jgi:hypothetical protein
MRDLETAPFCFMDFPRILRANIMADEKGKRTENDHHWCGETGLAPGTGTSESRILDHPGLQQDIVFCSCFRFAH